MPLSPVFLVTKKDIKMATIRKKSTKLSISLQNAKYEKLLAEAQSKDVPISRLIDDALDNRRILTTDEKRLLVSLRNDLSRVGSNLNQIAHALNISEPVATKKVTDVAEEVKSLASVIKPYLR
jgi:predicted DNA-binding ribbon-helix-helix protein